MNDEVMEILENYKQAISEIIEYQKHLANEITEVKTAIMDELINPIKDEYNKFEHDTALSDFREKYAEKLEGFNDKLKALEGDDFDIVEKAFDDFNARDDGMPEDEYVEKLAEHVQEQLDEIASAFGIEKEDIEEVKVETSDGEVEAKVEDGEVTEVENTEEHTEEKVETEDEKSDAGADAEETETKEEVETNTDAEEEEKRPEDATDTPDDDEENLKYWEEQLKKE